MNSELIKKFLASADNEKVADQEAYLDSNKTSSALSDTYKKLFKEFINNLFRKYGFKMRVDFFEENNGKLEGAIEFTRTFFMSRVETEFKQSPLYTIAKKRNVKIEIEIIDQGHSEGALTI